MNDADCVEFLQWALPHLRMRWDGFRKVRGQVCKRIARRLKELGIDDLDTYKSHLEENRGEWEILDGLCRITISRFHRDRKVFDSLRDTLLPDLAAEADNTGRALTIWSTGCASGEEPYTLSILWRAFLQQHYQQITLEIIATDTDPVLLERAASGFYKPSSLKELAPDTVDTAFETTQSGHRLRPEYREGVEFLLSDIRREMPAGPFDLIMCRNLVLTYFETEMQIELLEGMTDRMVTGGALVIGSHESLPPGSWPLERLRPGLPIFKKV